jgi:hypothetical protein
MSVARGYLSAYLTIWPCFMISIVLRPGRSPQLTVGLLASFGLLIGLAVARRP